MPLIEFRCGKCGKTFEKLMSLEDDRAGVVCPECGGKAGQNFTGKCYGGLGKPGGGCGGDCKGCRGCRH